MRLRKKDLRKLVLFQSFNTNQPIKTNKTKFISFEERQCKKMCLDSIVFIYLSKTISYL